jgi:GMP synthase (glutamine-hydrolysing)
VQRDRSNRAFCTSAIDRRMGGMKAVTVIRHVPVESLGNLETILRGAGIPLHVIECFDPRWPQIERQGFDPRRIAGLIVMGGPMNVDQSDQFSFLATEVRWLAQAIDAQLPTLGICLGAQLLAKAAGSKVYPNALREIGWYQLEMLAGSKDDTLLAGASQTETVFQWHGDTFDLPSEAVQLARTDTCEQQAFRCGPHAYGLQFHLEMTADMVEDWLAEPEMCGELALAPHVDPVEVRRNTPANLAAMAPLAQRVFGRFAELCRDRA